MVQSHTASELYGSQLSTEHHIVPQMCLSALDGWFPHGPVCAPQGSLSSGQPRKASGRKWLLDGRWKDRRRLCGVSVIVKPQLIRAFLSLSLLITRADQGFSVQTLESEKLSFLSVLVTFLMDDLRILERSDRCSNYPFTKWEARGEPSRALHCETYTQKQHLKPSAGSFKMNSGNNIFDQDLASIFRNGLGMKYFNLSESLS